MRDPARIPRLLALLSQYWLVHPDLRLGQIIGNFTPTRKSTAQDDMGEYPTSWPGDPYYVEDDVIEKALLDFGYGLERPCMCPAFVSDGQGTCTETKECEAGSINCAPVPDSRCVGMLSPCGPDNRCSVQGVRRLNGRYWCEACWEKTPAVDPVKP